MFPLKLGTDEQFRSLRSMLAQCGYTEEAVCKRVGIPRISHFISIHEGRSASHDLKDALDALIRLLMDGEAVSSESLGQHLPPGAVDTLLGLDVVRPVDDDPALLGATAILYCVNGLFIASDRIFPIRGNSSMPEDIVYSAITANTERFLSFVPSDPCGSLLDLCTGSGVAALVGAAKYAQRAWATDLAGRSVHFSEFNRRLNALPNVCAVQGDLYSAVEGLTFDRILAHPPYVPAEQQKVLFRDGGKDGELIFRRIIEGLPGFLNPGGRAYILTRATDRDGAPLEQRIRKWLGPAHSEFDVFLLIQKEQPGPDEFERLATRLADGPVRLGPNAQVLRDLEVTSLLYVLVVVQRQDAPRRAINARSRKAPEATNEAVEWFRLWHLRTAAPDFFETIVQSRPRPAERFRLSVTHGLQQGRLAPIDFRLKTDYPYVTDATVEPWIAIMIGFCDGERSVREVFEELRAQEVIEQDSSEEEFVSILSQLIGGGFLEVGEHPLPERRASAASPGAEPESSLCGGDHELHGAD